MDDQFKKDLIELLDQQFEKKFIKYFNQGFEALILPQFEDIDKSLTGIKRRLDSLENRVGAIDRKLDVMNDKWIDCDFRLKKIERIPAIAHQIKK